MKWHRLGRIGVPLPPVGRYVLIRHARGTWHDVDQEGCNYVVAKWTGDRFEPFGPDTFPLEQVYVWAEFDRLDEGQRPTAHPTM